MTKNSLEQTNNSQFTIHNSQFKTPVIWAIINATPDSFFEGSRAGSQKEIVDKARLALEDGASCLDIGGYSTRPGYVDVPEEEEFRRLRQAIEAIRKEFGDDVRLSVDTFRSSVVRRLYDQFGEFVVNDIQGGVLDKDMYRVVGELGLEYVMMSSDGTIEDMLQFFKKQIAVAHEYGVERILVDPGFGFGKDVAQNYQILSDMPQLIHEFQLPLFVGLSRKSMIWRPLEITAKEALNGTSVLNFAALERGADILRVHDVKQAVEAVQLFQLLKNN